MPCDLLVHLTVFAGKEVSAQCHVSRNIEALHWKPVRKRRSEQRGAEQAGKEEKQHLVACSTAVNKEQGLQ